MKRAHGKGSCAGRVRVSKGVNIIFGINHIELNKINMIMAYSLYTFNVSSIDSRAYGGKKQEKITYSSGVKTLKRWWEMMAGMKFNLQIISTFSSNDT